MPKRGKCQACGIRDADRLKADGRKAMTDGMGEYCMLSGSGSPVFMCVYKADADEGETEEQIRILADKRMYMDKDDHKKGRI